jgi:hypothetical protein
MLLSRVGQSQLQLFLLLLEGTGAYKPISGLLISLFLHILFWFRFDLLLFDLNRFGGLLLFGLEGLTDGVFGHEGSDLAAEVRLAWVETGVHDLYAALRVGASTM